MAACKSVASILGELSPSSRASVRRGLNLPNLAGKTCIVTGGSRGIGKAIAARFTSEGAHVIIVGRTRRMLNSALEDLNELRASADQRLRFHQGDVTKEETWAELFETAYVPEVLVNCAGISQRSLLTRMTEFDSRLVLETNLHSAILGSRFAIKTMIRNKTPGCIVNVSSLLAKKGASGAAVYAASKAGLLGLTSSLVIEYARYRIRVNALLPGYIDTEMTAELAQLGAEGGRVPLGRFGTVEEVADAAYFLAANPYANNCILNLDGGLSAV